MRLVIRQFSIFCMRQQKEERRRTQLSQLLQSFHFWLFFYNNNQSLPKLSPGCRFVLNGQTPADESDCNMHTVHSHLHLNGRYTERARVMSTSVYLLERSMAITGTHTASDSLLRRTLKWSILSLYNSPPTRWGFSRWCQWTVGSMCLCVWERQGLIKCSIQLYNDAVA